MGAGKFLHPPEIVRYDPLFAVGTLEKTKLIHHGKQEKHQGDAPEPQQPGLVLGPEEHIKKDRADAGGKGPFFHPQHKPGKLKPGEIHEFPSWLKLVAAAMGAMEVFLLENGKGEPLFAVGTLEEEKLIDQADEETDHKDLSSCEEAIDIVDKPKDIKQKKGNIGVYKKALNPQHKPGELKPSEIHEFPSFSVKRWLATIQPATFFEINEYMRNNRHESSWYSRFLDNRIDSGCIQHRLPRLILQ